jgi:hypothetical protein
LTAVGLHCSLCGWHLLLQLRLSLPLGAWLLATQLLALVLLLLLLQ